MAWFPLGRGEPPRFLTAQRGGPKENASGGGGGAGFSLAGQTGQAQTGRD